MSEAGAAEANGPPRSGEGRLLASGALTQGIAQASGLVALLVIVTVLARRLSVAELGAYGLVSSLSGYLLVLRNSVTSSAVRAMAAAPEGAERSAMFSTAAALYALVGAVTGLLIAAAGSAIALGILDGDLAREAAVGAAGLGLVTAAGIALSVYLDALRAQRLLVRAPATEIAAVALYLALMLTLIVAGAPLGVLMAASGAMSLLSGGLSALTVWRLRLRFRLERSAGSAERRAQIVPTAGHLFVIELSNLVMYAFDRVLLGAIHSARTVGLYEGPVRAHNLLYALNGALAVPVLPTAARYLAAGERARLAALVVRGSRYTLALFVPVTIVLMVLAEPLLEVWLGERFAGGATALTILVSYWLLYGALLATPGFLVGAGRAREVARIMVAVAAANLVLSLALTPPLGLEGPALGTAIPFAAAFPLMVRLGLRTGGVSLRELALRAWLPAYSLGLGLAAGLVGLRLALSIDSLPELALAGLGGLGAYWLAFYLWLEPGERAALRSATGS